MKLTLKEKKQEAQDCYSFIFQPDTIFSWKAGQYLRYHLSDPRPDERAENRFFTISAAPFEGHVMLTTRFVPGDGSTFKKDLQKLNIGDSIEASGPLGAFTVENPNLEYVFIAGGIGITPFRSILLELDHYSQPVNVTLLYANRSNDIVFKSELEALVQKHSMFKISYAIDPQKIDEDFIRSHTQTLQDPIYYLSGPEPMVKAMESLLTNMGIPKEKQKRDYFPGYKEI